jgi:medium-chain acyl-[acyl-carrier-protein] hydrolase
MSQADKEKIMATMVAPTVKAWTGYSRPNPRASLRLFCFPYSGGGVSAFRSWENSLPPDLEVVPIQLPGRENRLREQPFTDLTPLIQTLLDILPPMLDKPYVLFGHSLGALICFELTRELQRQRERLPEHLFVSAHRAPQRPLLHPSLHMQSDTGLLQELRNLGGTPEAVLQNKELMELLLPLFRADFSIYETYTYQPAAPLNCDLTAFCGTQDSRASREEMTSWQEQTSKPFKLRILPGDHFFIQSAQTQLLQLLSQDLVQILNRIY